jgi:hypothetical protein
MCLAEDLKNEAENEIKMGLKMLTVNNPYVVEVESIGISIHKQSAHKKTCYL